MSERNDQAYQANDFALSVSPPPQVRAAATCHISSNKLGWDWDLSRKGRLLGKGMEEIGAAKWGRCFLFLLHITEVGAMGGWWEAVTPFYNRLKRPQLLHPVRRLSSPISLPRENVSARPGSYLFYGNSALNDVSDRGPFKPDSLNSESASNYSFSPWYVCMTFFCSSVLQGNLDIDGNGMSA